MKTREIKFRAWVIDFHKEYMLSKVGIIPPDRESDTTISFTVGEGFLVNPNSKHVKVMQYTGLKDCNGKEIYEGDVVKAFHCVNLQNVHYMGSGFGIWVDPDHTGEDSVWQPLDEWSECSIEVVGNIYENPELLKTD